ncbi:Apoptosis inhibitor 5, partial [Podochytrium sp. JEL0797]
DLCEDDSASIRHAAIKSLPQFVQKNPDLAFKISDVLCQLLQTEIPSEINIVETALLTCYSSSPVLTARTVYGQLTSGAIPHIRSKIMSFLLPTLCASVVESKPLLTAHLRGLDSLLLESSKSVQSGRDAWISPSDLDDIMLFVTERVLESEMVAHDVEGEIGDFLLRILCSSVEAVTVFDPSNPAAIKLLSRHFRLSIPFYKHHDHCHKPTHFLKLLLSRVLTSKQFAKFSSELKRTAALKIFADTVKYGVDLEMLCAALVAGLTDLFQRHIPSEQDDSLETLMFTKLECILYTLYEVQMQNTRYFLTKPHPQLTPFLQRLYRTTTRLLTIHTQTPTATKQPLKNCFTLTKELLKPIDKRVPKLRFVSECVLSWHTGPDSRRPSVVSTSGIPSTALEQNAVEVIDLIDSSEDDAFSSILAPTNSMKRKQAVESVSVAGGGGNGGGKKIRQIEWEETNPAPQEYHRKRKG